MDFLLSPADKPQSVILVLLVAKGGSTHIVIYEWDSTLSLRTSLKPYGCSTQRLKTFDTLPLFLIPSTLSTSFMLVCEHGLSSYSNVLDSESSHRRVDLLRDSSDTFRGSSNAPLWVQWARPPRNAKRRYTHDDFYLCREDGQVHFFEIQKVFGEKESIRVALHFYTGPLHCNVDKGFAVMLGSLEDPADVLLAAGNMSDGGVYHCMPRQSPDRIQALANWAPLLDFLVLPVEKGVVQCCQDRIFACSGQADGHGAITELRSGLEAKIGYIGELEDANSMTSLWVLPDLSQRKLLVLGAHPLYSTGLVFDANEGELEALGDGETYFLDLESTTLAAAVLQNMVLFQVTPSEIRALNMVAPGRAQYEINGSRIHLAAMIDCVQPLLVLVSQDLGDPARHALCIRQFGIGGSKGISLDVEKSLDISFQPTSISTVEIHEGAMVCLGAGDGTVSVFIYTGTSISQIGKIQLSAAASQQNIRSIDGLAIVRSVDRSVPSLMMLAGRRDGGLFTVPISINFGSSSPQLGKNKHLDTAKLWLTLHLAHGRIGHHKLSDFAISVSQDSADLSSAFVNDGKTVRRLTLTPGHGVHAFSLDTIWFTDLNNVSAWRVPHSM